MDGSVEAFCRGCLNNFEDPTELLQYTEESRRLFVYSTGIQVKRNDPFTFQLCKECYARMRTSCKFKKMCRRSDKKIKTYISVKDVDDEEDNMDFSTFLKIKEENIVFRLPMLSGSSTPDKDGTKDDDNDSTCTSIQNFMTDMLKPEEIPDTEARIIREVIEEEADVLVEDSLDSQWLQDDVSNDNDFQLNLSLSRFSTPYSTNNDRMHSSDQREVTSTDITSGEDYDKIFINSALKQISDAVHSTEELAEENKVLQNVIDVGAKNDTKNMRCVIDKNLEKALKDEENKEFSLEALLASPANPNTSGASTPTIKYILFGDKGAKENNTSDSPNFEPDLDLLIGKLDKGKPDEVDLQGNFGLDKSNISQMQAVKLELGKENMGMLRGEFKGNIDLGNGGNLEKDKVNGEKLLEENLMHDISPEKIQESKSDLGNVNGGKSDVVLVKTEAGDFNFKKPAEKKLDFGKLSIGKFNMEKFKREQIQKGKLYSGKLHDKKIYLNEISLDHFLAKNNIGKGHHGKIGIDKLLHKGKSGKSNNTESQDEDSNAAILEEFLNSGKVKGKLQNIGIKGKSPSKLDNAVQINDAELTELLHEAFDQNLESKGKKSLNVQVDKEVSPNMQKPCSDKKISSPIEKQYCVTNFYCKMCNKKFRDLKALKIHFTKFHKHKIRTPIRPRTYHLNVCYMCGRTFTSNRSLKHHIKNHQKPTEYKCEKCSLIFKSENTLNTHRLTHRKKTNAPKEIKESDSKYVCNICGAISTSASNHIIHERRHSKTFTIYCQECGKGFYRTTDVLVHMRKHTGEKPFPCLYCDHKFSRRDSLNRHHKLHTGEKLYECQYCNQKFSKPYDLKKHEVKYNKTCLKLRE